MQRSPSPPDTPARSLCRIGTKVRRFNGARPDGPPPRRHVRNVPTPAWLRRSSCKRNREMRRAPRRSVNDPETSRLWNHSGREGVSHRAAGVLGESMHCPDGTRIPNRNLLLMLALAAGSWGLIYVAAVGLWPHRAIGRAVAVVAHDEREVPPFASLPDKLQGKSRRETGRRLNRKKHQGPFLALRVFRQVTSLN
jgi:hypothetical protein